MRRLAISDANRAWWTLAGACMGLFVLMLDSCVVTLALPSIARELDASASELQWVANAYLLACSVFVVTAGRLGDMFGRKRVFLAGASVFTAGLFVAAVAPAPAVLVAARAIQGLGAAGMLTLSLALVSEAFDEATRPRALGIWAGVSASALAIGPLLGGALVEALSWRWVFWIGIPPLLLTLLLTAQAARETRDEQTTHRLDVPGLLTLTVGLTAVVLVLVEGGDWGWTDPRSLAVAAVGVAALIAFALIEPRVRGPIVEFALFRNKPYLGATAAGFSLVGAYWGLIFFMPQYLQSVLGYSPAEAGALVVPITAPMIAISPLAPRLIERVGPRALMTFGMACGTLGVVLLTRIDATSGYATLLPGFLLFGIALGFVYAPMSTAAMAAMPHAKAGIAAGVLAMNRVLAGALILAATGAVFGELRRGHAGEPAGAAYAGALADALWIVVAVCAIGTLLTWAFVRAPAPVAPTAPPPASRSLAAPGGATE